MPYIPILSTLITFGFALVVFARYRYKKGAHLLFWGLGLILYGLGTLTEVLLAVKFNALALKVWYLSGAMLTAAWLGQGTVFLLIRKRGVAPILAGFLGIVSLIAISLIVAAPLKSDTAVYNVAQPASLQYKEILIRNGGIILLTILLNIYGTLTLVGGALYSAFLFWRKKVLVNRMVGNILIAIGALFPALAGSLVKVGLMDGLYISEFLGAVLMFAGFLRATSGQVIAPRTASVPASE